jgi:hypothetical protein
MSLEGRAGRVGRESVRGILGALMVGSLSGALAAQEPAYLRLKINEIIASNNSVNPTNCNCEHVDMLELYNPSRTEQIKLYERPLGGEARALKLTDGKTVWEFREGHQINPLGRFVVFCDKAECKEDCANFDGSVFEAHASFAIDKDGETVSLLGPDGELIDEVHCPPLSNDVTYGRCPDGSDTFVFNSVATASFGQCIRPPSSPFIECPGAPNQTTSGTCGSNVAPEIELIDYSTFSPASGEPVTLLARVRDEKLPEPPDIARVAIVYRLDGETEQEEPMTFLRTETDRVNLLDHWSIWQGSISGQVEGTVVDFRLLVVDVEGARGTSPGTLCPWPTGPCEEDADGKLPPGCAFKCSVPYQYLVDPPYAGPLVLNEVVAENASVIQDPSEKLGCQDGTQHCHYDDYLEIYNASDQEQDLSGLVLSGKPFHPIEGWHFPTGSRIQARQRLVVWVDGDGKVEPGTINPNDPEKQEFHTDFQIDGRSDEVILFQPVDRSGKTVFLPLDGLRWGRPGEPIDQREDFIPRGDSWKYLKGQSQPPVQPDPQHPSLTLSWKDLRYDEGSWRVGATGIGYGAGGLGTVLGDMKNGYLTVFCRRAVTIPDSLFEVVVINDIEISQVLLDRLYLEVTYDDGFIAYLNGTAVAARNLTRSGFDVPAEAEIAPTTQVFDITNRKDTLLKGSDRNLLAVEVHNASLGSNDLVFNARLFWGVEGLGRDESLSRIPDGRLTSPLYKLPGSFATPGSVNRSPFTLFRRGDAGSPADGTVDISDAIGVLSYLFQGLEAPSCLDAADADNSGDLDLTDAIFVLSFLFQSGKAPPPPGPSACGPDPDQDSLVDCQDPTCN